MLLNTAPLQLFVMNIIIPYQLITPSYILYFMTLKNVLGNWCDFQMFLQVVWKAADMSQI